MAAARYARPMKTAWMSGAIALLVGCGPAVDPGEGEETTDPSGTDPSSSGSTASLPTDGGPPATPPSTTSGFPDVGTTEPADISGTYLLALAAVPSPKTPLQFIADVNLAEGSMDLTLTPLTLDVGSRTEPREPLGTMFEYSDIPVLAGCFTVALGQVDIPGLANPITGSDITATVTLNGCFVGADFCGDAVGQITVPLDLDLTGSTFAAVEADPATLPEDFPSSC